VSYLYFLIFGTRQGGMGLILLQQMYTSFTIHAKLKSLENSFLKSHEFPK
jgi:hypothetical protein